MNRANVLRFSALSFGAGVLLLSSTAGAQNGVDVGSADIGSTDWHEWLMLGVRGRYWLGQ